MRIRSAEHFGASIGRKIRQLWASASFRPDRLGKFPASCISDPLSNQLEHTGGAAFLTLWASVCTVDTDHSTWNRSCQIESPLRKKTVSGYDRVHDCPGSDFGWANPCPFAGRRWRKRLAAVWACVVRASDTSPFGTWDAHCTGGVVAFHLLGRTARLLDHPAVCWAFFHDAGDWRDAALA